MKLIISFFETGFFQKYRQTKFKETQICQCLDQARFSSASIKIIHIANYRILSWVQSTHEHIGSTPLLCACLAPPMTFFRRWRRNLLHQVVILTRTEMLYLEQYYRILVLNIQDSTVCHWSGLNVKFLLPQSHVEGIDLLSTETNSCW